ncbi:MAG: TVP38/TMEM64 family protein [Candidatus Binatia bacterium]
MRVIVSRSSADRSYPVFLSAASILALLIGLAAAWQWTPLRFFIEPDRVTEWTRPFGTHPAAPAIVTAAYTLGTLVMFPRPILTVASVIVFGPILTLVCALSGLLLSALISFWAGFRLGSEKLGLLAGRYLTRIEYKLRRKGIWAVVCLRLLPVAPFTVVNILAGAVRIRPAHFFFGTLIGLLPGMITTVVFSDRLLAAWRAADETNILLLIIVSMAAAITIALLWRKIPEKLAS